MRGTDIADIADIAGMFRTIAPFPTLFSNFVPNSNGGKSNPLEIDPAP